MSFLKRLLKREEGVELTPSPHTLPSATTIVVVGDKGVGKSTLVANMIKNRKTVVFSPLESWRGAKKTLRTPRPGEAEVVVVDDLPAFGRGAEEELAKLAALQRHLGVKELYVVTQILESVPQSVFRQASVLVVFRAALNVNKLAAYLNDYGLAKKISAKAEALKDYQCFMVDLRKKLVSPVFINVNAEEIKRWLENPTETAEVEAAKVEEVEVRVEKLSIRQQILRLKRADRSLDHYQIAQLLGITPNHAKKELSRLRRAGLID